VNNSPIPPTSLQNQNQIPVSISGGGNSGGGGGGNIMPLMALHHHHHGINHTGILPPPPQIQIPPPQSLSTHGQHHFVQHHIGGNSQNVIGGGGYHPPTSSNHQLHPHYYNNPIQSGHSTTTTKILPLIDNERSSLILNHSSNQLATISTTGSTRISTSSSNQQQQQEMIVETIDDNVEDGYNPHFEAISPTPQDESRISPLTSLKDQILSSINACDRQIQTNEVDINQLKLRAQQLEAATRKLPIDSDEDDKQKNGIKLEPTLVQKIIQENTMKAKKAHQNLYRLLGNDNNNNLSETIALPLYNQPMDLPIIRKNNEQHQQFRSKLIDRINRYKKLVTKEQQIQAEKYDQQMLEWLKKVEKIESNPVKKQRDLKIRESFEKHFPEIRKQREDRERVQRNSNQQHRIRSDAELEEIMDGLQHQELEDKKMRSYIVIPPIMYTRIQLKNLIRFDNQNGYLQDPMSLYKEIRNINIWTEGEKEIFREKYLLNPKKFGIIAQYLERKSIADCINYYYLSKKHENYKQLLRKHVKKRTRAMIKAQQQQQHHQNLEIHHHHTVINRCDNSDNNDLLANGSTTATLTTTECSTNSTQCDNRVVEIVLLHHQLNNYQSYGLQLSTLLMNSTTTNQKTSNGNQILGRVCFGCHLKKQQQQQSTNSNLREKRYCPMPLCISTSSSSSNANNSTTNTSTNNTPKRKKLHLKQLPQQWLDMLDDNELKQQISKELQIPLDIKIGCARCVMRLNRRLSNRTINLDQKLIDNNQQQQLTNTSSSITNIDSSSMVKEDFRKVWSSPDDQEKLRTMIRTYGKNWATISSNGSFEQQKTPQDCYKAFVLFKNEFQLNSLTKSNQNLQDCKPLSLSQSSLKSDYDSSATMSADESSNNMNETNNNTATGLDRSSGSFSFPNSGSRSGSSTQQQHSNNVKIETKVMDDLKQSNQSSSYSTSSSSSFNRDKLVGFDAPQVPMFLINPNAPSIQISSSSNTSSSVPSTTAGSNRTPTPHSTSKSSSINDVNNLTSTTSTNNNNNDNNNNNSGGTCVRDLIWKAIEKSLSTETGAATAGISSSQPSSYNTTHTLSSESTNTTAAAVKIEPCSTVVQQSSSSSNNNSTPLCLKREISTPNSNQSLSRQPTPDLSKMDILASTALQQQQQQQQRSGGMNLMMMKPEGLAAGINFSYGSNSTTTTTVEDEVQDLSNKSSKRSYDQTILQQQPSRIPNMIDAFMTSNSGGVHHITDPMKMNRSSTGGGGGGQSSNIYGQVPSLKINSKSSQQPPSSSSTFALSPKAETAVRDKLTRSFHPSIHHHPIHYNELYRHMNNPDLAKGSITQGTPLIMPAIGPGNNNNNNIPIPGGGGGHIPPGTNLSSLIPTTQSHYHHPHHHQLLQQINPPPPSSSSNRKK
ncbi:nuclear receptor corepressor 2, partial [Dermatophagoides pteronyssinus]